jgi:dihydrolipoamide dehydrogenase
MAYDLLVLGGGPAGYLAAERAAHAGLSVLLVEKRHVGGVCLNEGCIPSKALLYSAKILEQSRHGAAYGVKIPEAALVHGDVLARKDKVVKMLVSGVKAKLKKNGVTIVDAEGVLKGRTSEGYVLSAGETDYTGKNLLIATGSVPVLPPIPGLKESIASGYALTNREILSLKEVPATLTVIGGGVIGLEMASYYAAAGSKVTVVEMLDRIGGPLDAQIADALLIQLKKKPITFELGAKVVAIGMDGSDTIAYEKNGKTETLKGDKVLVSIGRRPFTAGIGLETIGVETERGRIPTDDQGRTNRPGVYAAGDVNGVSMLAHTAYREAEVVVNHLLGKQDRMRYGAIPSVIYTQPEVACVGETSESAILKGMQVDTVKLPMTYSGRYVAENERGEGFVKVLVEKGSRRLVGVHLIGSYASEIIYGAALMVETEMRVDDVRELVFPHPTVSEVIREAMFEF